MKFNLGRRFTHALSRSLTGLATAFLLSGAFQATSQNLVRNGSFEQYTCCPLSIAPWVALEWSALLSNWPNAPEGNNYVLADTLYQDLTTVPGQAYTLAFNVAADLYRQPSTHVRVLWNGRLLTTVETIPHPYNPQTNRYEQVVWEAFTLSATATGTTSRLQLESADAIDYLLDNVRVTPLAAQPPTIVCPAPQTLECTNGGAVTMLEASVGDPLGNPLTVIWHVEGVAYGTNSVPGGGTNTSARVTFTAQFAPGTHQVLVSASNGRTTPTTCSTEVTVRDTQPPEILHAAAHPEVLWPPNHRLQPVTVQVQTEDECGPATWRIVAVTANEPLSPEDWKIVGATEVQLRASRRGNGGGRIYSIVVETVDAAGNSARRNLAVTVPHDRR